MKKILLLVTVLTIANILEGQVWASGDRKVTFIGKDEDEDEEDSSNTEGKSNETEPRPRAFAPFKSASGDTEATLAVLERLAKALLAENIYDRQERIKNFVSIKSALMNVPVAEREALVHLILAPETRLVTEDRRNVLGVIEALKLIHVSERSALVNLITARGTRLLTEDQGNAQFVINALREVPARERNRLAQLITYPGRSVVRADLENAADVINSLRSVPVDEREALVGLISNPETMLLRRDRNFSNHVIDALSAVAEPLRAPFVALIQHLLTDTKSNAYEVINALRLAPTHQWVARVSAAREATRALPWWRQDMRMNGEQRQTFNHTVIAALEREPPPPPMAHARARAIHRELIYDEAKVMREAFEALRADPRSRDVIAANLPKHGADKSLFSTSSTYLISILEDLLVGQRSSSELHFRITQALRTIRLLQGDESIERYPGYAVRDYQNYAYEGLPNIRQLFVLATRLLVPANPEDFIRGWMAENLRDQAHWNAFREPFGDRFPAIANQSNVGLALGADGERGNGFVTFLATALWENTQEVTPAMRRPLMNLKTAYRTHTQERLMPLIEALFMVMRGHNKKLLDPRKLNRPACAAGAYLNILKAITQTPGIADVAAHKLAGVEVQDCAKRERRADGGSPLAGPVARDDHDTAGDELLALQMQEQENGVEDGAFGAGEERRPDFDPENPGAAGGGGRRP